MFHCSQIVASFITGPCARAASGPICQVRGALETSRRCRADCGRPDQTAWAANWKSGPTVPQARVISAAISILFLLLAGGRLSAELPGSFAKAAAAVRRTVVTIRVGNDDPPQAADAGSEVDGRTSTPTVTVCTGVALDKGCIVAPLYTSTDRSIRITRAGGEQSTARVRVIDEYSGLALLQTDHDDGTSIDIQEQPARPGDWLISGSGWGAEPPVLSFGIVSGIDVALPQSGYPPLLRCDMRAAATSSGAAVVDVQGRLVGIVVLQQQVDRRQGWTYAVPARHVQRLLRTWQAQDADGTSLVVLKRRRPEVGMVLEGNADVVTVQRIRPRSPADHAGIQVGDHVLAADGVAIRSVYQAVRPILTKQPGDIVRYRLLRNGRTLDVQVTLGGGIELPAAPFHNLAQLVRPKIDLQRLPDGRYRAVKGGSEIGEVLALPTDAASDAEPPLNDRQKIELLEKALDRYRAVIVHLQQRLEQSEHQRLRSETLLRSLEPQAPSANRGRNADKK